MSQNDFRTKNGFFAMFNRVWNNIYGKWAIILSVLALVLIVLRAAGITNVVLAIFIALVPLLLAVTISWMLNPIVWWLAKKTRLSPKGSRSVVFISFLFVLTGIVALLVWLFISQFGIFATDVLGKRDINRIHSYLLKGDIGGLAKYSVTPEGSIVFADKSINSWWIKEVVGKLDSSLSINTKITDAPTFNSWLAKNVHYLTTDEAIRNWNADTTKVSDWTVVNTYIEQLHFNDIKSLNLKAVTEENGFMFYHYTTPDTIAQEIVIKTPLNFSDDLRIGSSYHFLLRLMNSDWLSKFGFGWIIKMYDYELSATDWSGIVYQSFTIMKVTATVCLTVLITVFITWYLIGKFEKISIWLTKNLPTADSEKKYIIARSVHSSIFGWLKGLAIDELFILTFSTMIAIVAGLSGGSGILLKTCIIFGLFAALMNLIPFFGPILGGAPIVVAGIMEVGNTGAWGPLIVIIVGLILMQIIEGVWLVPIAYSKQTDLHPVVVILGVIVFGAVFGLWGMPFAVPVLAMIKSISINAYHWTPFRITRTDLRDHRKEKFLDDKK